MLSSLSPLASPRGWQARCLRKSRKQWVLRVESRDRPSREGFVGGLLDGGDPGLANAIPHPQQPEDDEYEEDGLDEAVREHPFQAAEPFATLDKKKCINIF